MSDDMRCTQCGRTTDSGKAYGYACPQGMNCGPFEQIGNTRIRPGTIDLAAAKDARIAALERQLAEAREALIWCSGSDDFQEGGKAREGWLKLSAPILAALKGTP